MVAWERNWFPLRSARTGNYETFCDFQKPDRLRCLRNVAQQGRFPLTGKFTLADKRVCATRSKPNPQATVYIMQLNTILDSPQQSRCVSYELWQKGAQSYRPDSYKLWQPQALTKSHNYLSSVNYSVINLRGVQDLTRDSLPLGRRY